MRNMQKALLNALLLPNGKMAELQNERKFTELMMLRGDEDLSVRRRVGLLL